MKQKVSSANNQVEIIKLTSNAISVGIQNLAKVFLKKRTIGYIYYIKDF